MNAAMPSSSPSSFRSRRRSGAVDAPQGFFGALLETASRGDVLLRLGLCLAAAAVLLVMLHGWEEPFPFQTGSVPPRGVEHAVG